MGRIIKKSGDIFEVTLSNKKNFIQFIYKDKEYLDGDLIRAFDFDIGINEEIEDINIFARKNVKFYAHTMINVGLDLGVWKKVGNLKIESDFSPPLFRSTDDVYSRVQKSYNWWLIKGSERKKIGELTEDYKHLPVAGVKPPDSVLQELETGWDGFKRPE